MSRKVTVNLFEVSRTEGTQPLSATLDEFAALTLDQRLRTDVRLEHIDKHPPDTVLPFVVYLLNFAKAREIGPGKMAADHPVSDVGLSPDELFGEETAALYIPAKNWILVLNNHYGIGPSRMATYFNALDPGSDRHFFYTIAPKIDQSALEKMQAMPNFAEVEITANVGAFETGEMVGESVYEATSGVGAQRLSLKLCANEAHKKGYVLNLQNIRGFIDRVLARSDDVSVLKVKSADQAATDQDRVINLIEHKIKLRYSDSALQVFNHRYTLASKINLLRQSCRYWLDTLT